MSDFPDDGRVQPPLDDDESHREFGRQLALDSLLRSVLGVSDSKHELLPSPSAKDQDECEGMRELSPVTSTVGVNSSSRLNASAALAQGRGRVLANAPSVLRFLHRVLQFSGESRYVTALTWMVMAVLCSGMALTIVFCIVLVMHGVGVNVHVDAPQVVKNSHSASSDGKGDSDAVRSDGMHAGGVPTLPSDSTSVARLIHTAECHWAIGSHPPKVGDDLETGRKLVLRSGLAEVMFESGVRAIVQGPATLEVSSKKSAFLRQGKVTVKVIDPDASGFVIYAPGMKYTDLGTEFAVYVAKDGSQEMHVFRGKVEAANLPFPVLGGGAGGDGRSNPKSETSNPSSLIPQLSPLLLSADQAVHIASPGKPFERIAANEKRFYRSLLEPIPIFGTGVGLDRGAADPHWEITKISTDPKFKPRPAVVAVPAEQYVRDARDNAQWISNSTAKDDMPVGCRWTFRAHFDLSGFNPATVCIEGRVSADNYLVEVRLNGEIVPIPPGTPTKDLVGRWLPLKIEAGFASGDNTLEIVVENADSPVGDHASAMALCVDWIGTAQPLLKLKAEE